MEIINLGQGRVIISMRRRERSCHHVDAEEGEVVPSRRFVGGQVRAITSMRRRKNSCHHVDAEEDEVVHHVDAEEGDVVSSRRCG